MTIITISRQYGSGGEEIAARLCEILGYQVFDKRMIFQAAQEVGLSEQEVVDYSEENHKIRGFLDRLFGPPQPVARMRVWKEDPAGARTVEELQLTEEALVALVQKAVRSAHRAGNLVIAGRGGQAILKDAPDAIHIRIEAPVEQRIQIVKQQLKQTKSDFHADIDIRREAQDLIEQKDEASRDYLMKFYHVAWNDPLLYHLVINTGKMSIEQAVQAIASVVHSLEAEVEVV
jgi:cytidylate kinase